MSWQADVLSSTNSHITNREIARRKLVSDWWSEHLLRYLKDLKRHYVKQRKPTNFIAIGQAISVFSANMKRINWPIGRVTDIVKGKDGPIRKVHFLLMEKARRTGTNRAIQCLYPLEVEPGTIDADFSEKHNLFGDYFTSAGDLWKQDSMEGGFNNSTTVYAEGRSPLHDETMVMGTRTRYDPPRMLEENLEGNDKGSDE